MGHNPWPERIVLDGDPSWLPMAVNQRCTTPAGLMLARRFQREGRRRSFFVYSWSRLVMGQEYHTEVVGSKRIADKTSESALWVGQFLKMDLSEIEKEVSY